MEELFLCLSTKLARELVKYKKKKYIYFKSAMKIL